MRLKRPIKCVLGRKGCSFNIYMPKDGLKIFDRKFCRLKIRHAPGRPTEIDTDKIKVLVDENPKKK